MPGVKLLHQANKGNEESFSALDTLVLTLLDDDVVLGENFPREGVMARPMMRDLKSAKAMWWKASLFLVIGLTSSVLLFLELPTFRVALLVCLTIWGFCRAYYFAFYVIQHYVDSNYRFSGLLSFVSYALRKRSDL